MKNLLEDYREESEEINYLIVVLYIIYEFICINMYILKKLDGYVR